MAQMVERILGKDEVISSILISSSRKAAAQAAASLSCRHDGMADVTDSKSVGSNTVWVQVPLPAPKKASRALVLGAFYIVS